MQTTTTRKKSTSPERANTKGFIYLQAGALKGKKLTVITSPGLRPIGSRVKEVFFNWVQFDIVGTRVLDLFSGSGALGFEALSRGCKSLHMCEYTLSVYKQLQSNYKDLNLTVLEQEYGVKPQVQFSHHDSYAYVSSSNPQDPYDLVFVDPPFMQEQELKVLTDLANNHFLSDQALIFLQIDSAYQNLVKNLDARFEITKFKKIGNVLLYLLTYHLNPTNA